MIGKQAGIPYFTFLLTAANVDQRECQKTRQFKAQSFFFEMVKPPPKFHVCLQKVFALREDDSTVMVPEATCDHVAALEGVQEVSSLVAETFGTGDVLAVCTFTNVHRLAFCAWI